MTLIMWTERQYTVNSVRVCQLLVLLLLATRQRLQNNPQKTGAHTESKPKCISEREIECELKLFGKLEMISKLFFIQTITES